MPSVLGRSTGKARSTGGASRELSLDQTILGLRKVEPELFQPYETHDIAQALLEQLYPKGVAHEDIVRELIESRLITYARRYNPRFDLERPTRKASIALAVPKVGDLASLALGIFTPDTVMRDGRRLGRWSLDEFRAEYKGMGDLIARFSGAPGNTLIDDVWA